MEVSLPFLNDLVFLFVAGAVIAYLCYRLHLVPIAGFLLAGVLIGPHAAGLVSHHELVEILAEVGVILLLFTIGLEFSLERLLRIGRAIFIAGGLQVALTIAVLTLLLTAFGKPWQTGVYTGCLVALSSTAIVLGLLAQRMETDTPVGRLSLAILIFQDLAVIAMVLLVPILAGRGGSALEVLWVLGRALILIVAVLALASRVVPWVLELVAHTRRQELFLLAVVAICFGTAAMSSMFGVSLALGAFLAGLIVSGSTYKEHAMSEIVPFRTIFSAVFFISVGMLLDVRFLVERPLMLLASAGVVILLKTLTTYAGVAALGYPTRVAAAAGLSLAQIGEFSFVLERTGRNAGLSPAGLGQAGEQAFVGATVLLMILTPFLVQAGPKLGDLLAGVPFGRASQSQAAPEAAGKKRLEDHVIVIGYGPAGSRLVKVLRDTGIPFVVVEMNPASVKAMHRQGIAAIYGDAARRPILEAAGIGSAKLCVVVISDPNALPSIIRVARYLNPTLQLIVRTRLETEVTRLRQMGADIVVPEEMETTVRIFSYVLGAYMIPQNEIDRRALSIRAQDYGILLGGIHEGHLMLLDGLSEDGMRTRTVAVREASPAAGRTLGELALRVERGLTVLAVRRNDKTIASPSGEFRVLAGDRLVLMGTAERFSDCADLFRCEDAV